MNLTSEEQTGDAANKSKIRKTARNVCRNLLRHLTEKREKKTHMDRNK